MQEGILNVNKPLNLTSHDVVARVRWLASVRRVGHAGTLDPLATGVLVLALGRATRLLEYVTDLPKTYVAVVHFGRSTTTYDAEGEVIHELPVAFSQTQLEVALEQFRGDIMQIPPMHSAIKKGGKPLYELARQGMEVAREARPVSIHELELLSFEAPLAVMRVHCSSGTYIRSLAHDLGEALGCGAYLAGLERTAIGSFGVENAVALDDLTAANLAGHLLPPRKAVAHLPRLELEQDAARRLAQGQSVPGATDHVDGDLVQTYDSEGAFVGVAVAAGEVWRARKIFASQG